MSTLARVNSQSKKPQYKDYVSFLDSYRNGKKDDQHSVITSDSGVNFSLTNSSNNSSSSVFSDISDVSTKNGFGCGKTSLPPKQTVKTEMFIEIKSPAPPQNNYTTQVFEVRPVKEPQEITTKSVSDTAKIFENNGRDQGTIKKSAIGEMAKKFETAAHQKPPVKRATSIGEVSKIFESNGHLSQNTNNSGTLRKQKNFNAVPKPFQPSAFVDAKPAITKPAILSPKPTTVVPVFPKYTPEPPKSHTDSVDSALSSLSMSPSPPQCVSPPPHAGPMPFLSSAPPAGPALPPPPPPPLPPAGFNAAPIKSAYNAPKAPTPDKVKVQTHGQLPSPASSNGTLDRNDPRVKKAVYGALRNMYGAFHDQANDYLATLPKNRVKKNNGLDSIIDSIALQGGLDKLNGRVNPRQESE